MVIVVLMDETVVMVMTGMVAVLIEPVAVEVQEWSRTKSMVAVVLSKVAVLRTVAVLYMRPGEPLNM